MKFLTDRREIAEEMNIKRTPVITMDISKCMDGYDDCYKGSKVLVATPTKRYPDSTRRCTAKMFGDESGNENHDKPWTYKRIHLTCPGAFMSDSFGYHDVMEMVEWSNCRILQGGQEVLVVFDTGINCYIRKMKVSERVDGTCYTVAMLKDIDE